MSPPICSGGGICPGYRHRVDRNARRPAMAGNGGAGCGQGVQGGAATAEKRPLTALVGSQPTIPARKSSEKINGPVGRNTLNYKHTRNPYRSGTVNGDTPKTVRNLGIPPRAHHGREIITWEYWHLGILAEGEGFEPSIRLNTVYTLSRRAPSTARPPLHSGGTPEGARDTRARRLAQPPQRRGGARRNFYLISRSLATTPKTRCI